MLLVTPSYWDRFACLGSACTDNCCIGWEIAIDAETAKTYQTLSGPLGEQLRQNIDWEAEPCFRLQGERCPFLNQQNLCDIQSALGESALCEICREHPRFYQWMGDRTEAGLGLCCEAAAALLLETPFSLIEREAPGEPDDQAFDLSLREGLLQGRNAAFHMLQDKSVPLNWRLSRCLALAADLQEAMDWGGDIAEIAGKYPWDGKNLPGENRDPVAFFQELLVLYSSLEPMDPAWPGRLEKLSAELPRLLPLSAALDAFAYRQLALYWLYRYWMAALFDGELLPKVKLAVCSVMIAGLLDIQRLAQGEEITPKTQICTLKAYSKEIEYNEENRLHLEAETWENPLLSVEVLQGMLLLS